MSKIIKNSRFSGRKVAIILITGATDDGFIKGVIEIQTDNQVNYDDFDTMTSCLLEKLDELQENNYIIASNEPLILKTASLYDVREHFTKKRINYIEEIWDWWVD